MAINDTQRVIMLLADGARADVMEQMLKAGDLPHIARWIVEPGSFRSGVTVFPSTTGPAYLPFLTGTSPGSCNLPGIRWFDKARFHEGRVLSAHRSYCGFESLLFGSDIARHIRMVFELVPDSYSIFNSITRGAGSRNLTRMMKIWYWYYAHLTDRWAFIDGVALKKMRHALAKKPRFLFVVFPGVDEYAHLAHPHHPATLEQYRCLDHAVDALVRALIERDEWETTQLWIVSDHGHSKTDHHFCLNTFLDERHLKPFFYPLIYRRFGRRSASMVSGNAMSHLYFRNSDGWMRPTTGSELRRTLPTFIEELIAEPAVDIIAVRNDEGGVDVFSRRGKACIRTSAGRRIRYRSAGGDPFGYGTLPEEMDDVQCLARTMDSDYPDAPVQLLSLIRSPRAGDVLVSAAPGHDLRLKFECPEHRGSHGSLHRDHMLVPILCNQRLVDRPIRTVDVFPSYMQSLAIPIPPAAEGESLFSSSGGI